MTRRAGRVALGVLVALVLVTPACGGSDPAAAPPEATATVVAAAPDGGEAADGQPTPAPSTDTEAGVPATDGSGDESASEPPRSLEAGDVVVLDPGEEPRVELGPVAAHTRSVNVTVDERTGGVVGGEPIAIRESAEFVVDVDLVPTSDGSRALIVPTITAIDATTLTPTNGQVGPQQWILDRNGRLVEVDAPDLRGTPVVAAAALLEVPELFAVVPAEAVGVGAQWQYAISAKTIFTVDLTAISDTTIELTVAFDQSDEEGTVTLRTTGLYDRASLVAIDVETTLHTEVTSQTTRSGEVIDVEVSFDVDRSYTSFSRDNGS